MAVTFWTCPKVPMDRLDVEHEVLVDDLMELQDVRRVDLLLLTAELAFILEGVVAVVEDCQSVDYLPGLLLLAGLLLLLDCSLAPHFQWVHRLLD